MKHIILFFGLILTFSRLSICQEPQVPGDTSYRSNEITRVIPGIEYEAGWLHEFIFGAHWRDVWTESYDVEVLDLEKFAGGLIPSKRGGGKQTKTLHLKGNDGIKYKFRSVNKDPVMQRLQGPTPGILKDQTSIEHPFGSMIVAPLQSKVGILHAPPILVVMPDNTKLGEFRNDFKNVLGTIEINPDENNIPGSDKVIGTDKLFKRLENERDESVDSKDFLKARLIDILIGDWDRSRDQWNWARFKSDSIKIFKPIPRDRDQAFTKFDGIVPSIAVSMIPDINDFGYDYPSMKYMTWTGRHLDQHFLVFLDRKTWDSLSAFVQSTLTDAVIENAVKQLPPAAYKISKDELLAKLKSRRSQLMDASSEFYELVNTVSDIFGTDKRDFVYVRGLPDGQTEVSIYKEEDGIAGDGLRLLHRKSFANYMTNELRIYLQGGDDKIEVTGTDVNSPTIRIIGGEGKDELIDNSNLPVKFYDAGNKTKVTEGNNTYFDDERYTEPWDSLQAVYDKIKHKLSDDERDKYEEDINDIKYNVERKDRGNSLAVAPYFAANPDYGVLFGGSVILYKYGFRSQPYVNRIQLKAGYSPGRKTAGGVLADFRGIFRNVVGGANTILHIRYSGIEINNFFGFGNETPYNETLYRQRYYNAWNEEVLLNPYLEFPQDRSYAFSLGVLLDYFHLEENNNTLIHDLSPYGSKERSLLLGASGGLIVDKRDNPTAPYKGFYLGLHGNVYPKLSGDQSNFGKTVGDMRAYLYLKTFTPISLALRVRGEKVWGTYPFYQSAFIGGSKSVRGFSSERFAGDASALGSAELRLELFKLKLLISGTYGIFGFAESGRIWLRGEESKMWHTGYGGGIYVYLLNRDYTFSLAFARSKEKTSSIYFGTGFAF